MKEQPLIPMFSLGRIVVTAAALWGIPGEHGKALLERHAATDYGDITAEQRRQNDVAVLRGGAYGNQVLSEYLVGGPLAVIVYTNSNRSETVVMLKGEFGPDLAPELFDLPPRAERPRKGRLAVRPGLTSIAPKVFTRMDRNELCPFMNAHVEFGHQNVTAKHRRLFNFGETLSVYRVFTGEIYMRTLADCFCSFVFSKEDAVRIRRVSTPAGFEQVRKALWKETERDPRAKEMCLELDSVQHAIPEQHVAPRGVQVPQTQEDHT